MPTEIPPRIAIVVSRFNEAITSGLLDGARTVLAGAGLRDGDVPVVQVPGAFEIPLAAKRLAATGHYDAIVTLGCLIKGDTMHFEYIASAVSHGIMAASLETGVPVAFGVLTTLTDDQAEARAAPGADNKGAEAARAALDMIQVCRRVDGELQR